MNISISKQAVLKCISRDEENNKCFDCGTIKPLWASTNNGIMICLHCCGLHRNTLKDVHISRVRSLNLDMWTEKHLKLMEEGGNQKLKTFLQTYDLDEVQDIGIKYKSKAADYYRRMLEANATLKPFTEIAPTYEEGRTLIDGSHLDQNGNIIE